MDNTVKILDSEYPEDSEEAMLYRRAQDASEAFQEAVNVLSEALGGDGWDSELELFVLNFNSDYCRVHDEPVYMDIPEGASVKVLEVTATATATAKA